MKWTTRPGAVHGTVRVPGSKSITHRAHILAALGHARVEGALDAADTRATADAMARYPELGHVDCGNSGTTLRLLTGLAARLDAPVSFSGDPSLSGRPNGPLLDALARAGATIRGGPTLPYTIEGPIQPGAFTLPANVSSQYASSLLLALPFLEGDSTLRLEKPIASRPYIAITLAMMADAGLEVHAADGVYHIPGNQSVKAACIRVEGDWSTAAFPLVAGAIAGAVTVEGLRLDSPQGDKKILAFLEAFGAEVEVGTSVTASAGALRGTDVDVFDTPDLFPALAALAACATGTTTFTGGTSLRDKESDRIAAMAEGLTAMGVRCQETDDGLLVQGNPDALKPATVHGHHDHRIHMALSLLGLRCGVTVTDAESVGVSYPDFHIDMRRLQGEQ